MKILGELNMQKELEELQMQADDLMQRLDDFQMKHVRPVDKELDFKLIDLAARAHVDIDKFFRAARKLK